ncbi:hypothetical protein J6590_017898 [Homalodisca vitripennis]|nr:hypothetical protein J6590_017898 [Homalodisca vitripennis]
MAHVQSWKPITQEANTVSYSSAMGGWGEEHFFSDTWRLKLVNDLKLCVQRQRSLLQTTLFAISSDRYCLLRCLELRKYLYKRPPLSHLEKRKVEIVTLPVLHEWLDTGFSAHLTVEVDASLVLMTGACQVLRARVGSHLHRRRGPSVGGGSAVGQVLVSDDWIVT